MAVVGCAITNAGFIKAAPKEATAAAEEAAAALDTAETPAAEVDPTP
jgi:hypothetical protein